LYVISTVIDVSLKQTSLKGAGNFKAGEGITRLEAGNASGSMGRLEPNIICLRGMFHDFLSITKLSTDSPRMDYCPCTSSNEDMI
jgi:hypothetical protein